jgi:hypothetical protein
VAAHDVSHREEQPKQAYNYEEPAEQLAVTQHELEFALVVLWHKRILFLLHVPLPYGRATSRGSVLQKPLPYGRGSVTGADLTAGSVKGPPATLSSARPKEVSISRGSGNTIVVFFSDPISTSVCR